MPRKLSQNNKSEVKTILESIVPKYKQFNLMFHKNVITDKEVTDRAKIGWLKWRSVTTVLCNRRILSK